MLEGLAGGCGRGDQDAQSNIRTWPSSHPTAIALPDWAHARQLIRAAGEILNVCFAARARQSQIRSSPFTQPIAASEPSGDHTKAVMALACGSSNSPATRP